MNPAWLAIVAIAACSAKPAPPKTEAPAKPDPWAAANGSNEPIPKWASDPPAVLRDKINGVNAHAIVLTYQTTFAEYRDVVKVVESTPGVAAAEPFIMAEVDISSAGHAPISIVLKAVDPERVGNVLAVGKHLKTGTLASLATGTPPSVILGDDLARKLGVHDGDQVTVTPPADSPAFQDRAPHALRVTGTFHVDFDEYDERLAYVSLPAAQAMVGRGDQVMGVELVVKDIEQSAPIAKAIQDKLGDPPYKVQDWYELNRELFTKLYGDKRP